MTAAVNDQRAQIQRAAVRSLNSRGVENTTQRTVCTMAGVTESEFTDSYLSMNALFSSIVSSLLDEHRANIAKSVLPRRSLTESMHIAVLTFWKLVEERPDDHLATRILLAAELANPVLTSSDGVSVHDSFVALIDSWLVEIQNVHRIRWELPTVELARLTLATLDGLAIDYLFHRDSTESRRMVHLFSYHLAQHGKRAAKNTRQ